VLFLLIFTKIGAHSSHVIFRSNNLWHLAQLFRGPSLSRSQICWVNSFSGAARCCYWCCRCNWSAGASFCSLTKMKKLLGMLYKILISLSIFFCSNMKKTPFGLLGLLLLKIIRNLSNYLVLLPLIQRQNQSVAFGGITPPAPAEPKISKWEGITKRALSPTCAIPRVPTFNNLTLT